MTPWWQDLFSFCRPGSRTVLCDPHDGELAIELARRGYRLLILHDGTFDVAGLRREMQSRGLQSQLMGSQVYSEARPVSLVPDFYELWIFADAPKQELLAAADLALKAGSPIVWQADLSAPEPGRELIPGLARTVAVVKAL